MNCLSSLPSSGPEHEGYQTSLMRFLVQEQQAGRIKAELRQLITVVSRACKRISIAVSKGALGHVLGEAGTGNIQGEAQKRLDIISNEILLEANAWGGHLAACASEEMEHCQPVPKEFPRGDFLLLFDPLDGSSNIDINVTVGTIFSVLRAPPNTDVPTDAHFLQQGKHQVAAGYCIYGPSTMLVLTLGHGTHVFTLDREESSFLLTQRAITLPAKGSEFAINLSNQRHWERPMQQYVQDLLAGETGPRGRNFNMRWIASMVAETHRILHRGGIFSYPWDRRQPQKPGHLRLMYEANPMAFIIEQAGGAASTGRERLLDVQPTALHQRIPVFLGSQEEVKIATDYHLNDDEKHRTSSV